ELPILRALCEHRGDGALLARPTHPLVTTKPRVRGGEGNVMNKALSPMLGDTALAAVAALVLGCASAPVPTEQMESSAATIRAAQEVGAADVPSAALHLQLAQEQMDFASNLIESGGDDELRDAQLVLMRAKSDADLALALARERS